jgi:hypothetical protein
VLVLEEIHDSRPSLIENAIVLTRLHAHYGVREIAVEGYLQDEPRLDASWFNRLPGSTLSSRAEVAVRLLKEGEISAPEFMVLVYPDIELLPAEVGSEYKVTLRDGALQAAQELAQRVGTGKGKEFTERIDKLQTEPISAEDELKMAEELDELRVSKNIVLPTQSLLDWQSWMGFWRGRAAGNNTMADAVLLASADGGVSPVVLNSGVAHTEGLIRRLRNANRPYAVITPLAVRNHEEKGQIDRYYSLREDGKSVKPRGAFMDAIYAAGGKKPQPVINRPWLEVNGLLYEFTEEIATGILGSSLQGDAKAPYGFSPGQFDTQWIQIDTKSIETVQDGDRRDVVFSLGLRPIQGGAPKTYWMKATLDSNAGTHGNDADSIESLLKDVLSEAQSETDAPSQAEDSAGIIHVGGDVRAVFGSTKEDVLAKSLHIQR